MIVLSKNTVDQLSYQIQVLQQLQRLLTTEATLADVTALLASVEANYGAECLLEDVIQRLVTEHLTLQIEQRNSTCRYA